jgi:hypothetical protein
VTLFAGIHILTKFLALTGSSGAGLEGMTLISPFTAVSSLVDAFSPDDMISRVERRSALLGWGMHIGLIFGLSVAVLGGLWWQFGRLVRDR